MTDVLPLHTLKQESGMASLKFETIVPVNELQISPSHRHDYFEIFLFRKGGGAHMIDFAQHEIHDNSLHFVFSGQVHQLSREADAEGWVVMFSKDFLLSLLDFQASQLSFIDQPPASPTVELSDADFTLLHSLITQIGNLQPLRKNEWQNPGLVRSFMRVIALKTSELLQPSAEKTQTTADAAGCKLARQFRGLVEEHYKALHQVADYADKLAVTAGHLNVVSKTWLQKTAREVIQERILLEAKRLLLHSEMASKEIAYSLNFDDPSHFAKFFKTHTGASPGDFRQQIREIYPR